MDPRENIREQIRLALNIQSGTTATDDYDASRLSELILGLADWAKKGGFVPGTYDPVWSAFEEERS